MQIVSPSMIFLYSSSVAVWTYIVVTELSYSIGPATYLIYGQSNSLQSLENGQYVLLLRFTEVKSTSSFNLTPGFQFRGTKADLEQIEGFSMVEMGKTIKSLAPDL